VGILAVSADEIVWAVFGAVPRDPHRPRSLAEALRRGLVPPRFMPEALAILRAYDARPRKPTWALPARSLYNDPGWDNVVRALEEDR
jgi:hypothetical protein